MTDIFSPEQRHYVMSRIRGRDTKPELLVRHWLWHHGYRYRLNVKSVPGRPDLVLRRYHTAIFVNGCFWHGHQLSWASLAESGERKVESCPGGVKETIPEGLNLGRKEIVSAPFIDSPVKEDHFYPNDSKCCKIPKTNRSFWVEKIRRNHERDESNYRLLRENGWLVLVIWECELKKDLLESTMTRVELLMNEHFLSFHSRHNLDNRKSVIDSKRISYEQEEGTTAAIAAESHN